MVSHSENRENKKKSSRIECYLAISFYRFSERISRGICRKEVR